MFIDFLSQLRLGLPRPVLPGVLRHLVVLWKRRKKHSLLHLHMFLISTSLPIPGMAHMSLEYKLPPASTLSVAPETKEAPGDSRKHTAEET